jgi:hypothetical protein
MNKLVLALVCAVAIEAIAISARAIDRIDLLVIVI